MTKKKIVTNARADLKTPYDTEIIRENSIKYYNKL
jgi:hypothetical protein